MRQGGEQVRSNNGPPSFRNSLDELKRHPAVNDLEALDDAYRELRKEHEDARRRVAEKYEPRYAELLERRRQILQRPRNGVNHCGTPGLAGFWRVVLQSSADLHEDIQTYDEPVFDYMKDVHAEWLDAAARDLGFKIRFVFGPNPYFENQALEKVYHTERKSQYEPLECVKIDATKIGWYAGKNVTVDVVARKKGRRRQGKPRKEEVPRPSFFRTCFRTLGPNVDVPEDARDESEADESADIMECLLYDDYQQGLALRDHLVPHAVRWYTGEACGAGETEEDHMEEDRAEASESEGGAMEEEEEDEESDAAEGDDDDDMSDSRHACHARSTARGRGLARKHKHMKS